MTFQDELHHPSPVRHKQTTATLYQEKEGEGKKGKQLNVEGRRGGGNNLTGHLIFTVFFAAQALSCLLKGGTLNSCSRFLLAFFIFLFLSLTFFFSQLLLQKKAEGKTDPIHKSSHLCSHLVGAERTLKPLVSVSPRDTRE